MGLSKRHLEERHSISVRDDIGGYVCARHFEDRGLEKYIKKNGVEIKCDYCDEEDLEDEYEEELEPAVPVSELVSYMLECIQTQYDNPGEWMYFESAEGGYHGANVYDTRELLYEVIGLEVEHDGLSEDILDCIVNDEWCERDPYGDTESESLLYTWQAFSKIVKHRTRYVFYKNKYKGSEDIMEPYEILDGIGKTVYNTKQLFNTSHTLDGQALLFDTYQFHRARQHRKRDEAKFAEGLGSPPSVLATVNRMSPAGISMFYCSDNEKTAIAETLNRRNKKDKYITVGCFENLRPLNIINLHFLNTISIFDLEETENYQAMQFLRVFKDEISKSIARDGKEHYDYVPTQIVTEYFRDVFPMKYGIPIDGIQYPSVKDKGSSCYVLFFEQQDIIDKSPKKLRKKRKPDMSKVPPALTLVNKTVKTTIWK